MAGSLVVGIWPLPLTDEIVALLQPAADLQGGEIEHGPGWTTWTVHDGPGLIGAAHCRRTVENMIEIVLVGGTQFREWIGRLDSLIVAWARDEGASCLRAYGRCGWVPVLTKLGWSSMPLDGGVTAFERDLS